MPEHPLMSIGLATYNRPQLMKKALSCLMAQTYPNLEILVSDNCSEGDETRAIAQEAVQKDPRVKYFRQVSNIGPADNFGFLLNTAAGEFFMFAADDDQWEPTFVEELLNSLIQNPQCSCVMSAVAGVNKEGQIEQSYHFVARPPGQELKVLSPLEFCWLAASFGIRVNNYIYGIFKKEFLKTVYFYQVGTHGSLIVFERLYIFAIALQGPVLYVDKILFYKILGLRQRQAFVTKTSSPLSTYFKLFWQRLEGLCFNLYALWGIPFVAVNKKVLFTLVVWPWHIWSKLGHGFGVACKQELRGYVKMMRVKLAR